jgi:deazaflavin-dependent oxidoreductase (nitroreductase family)
VHSSEDVIDSPVGWVADHIREYVESGGKKGHRWRGTDTLLLTTKGRKSGQSRRTALIYGKDGDHFLVVASHGGGPKQPLWFLNLLAEPRLQVQVGQEIFEATARPATPDERPRLWDLMVGIFSEYARMAPRAAKAGREIPVVIIERIDS